MDGKTQPIAPTSASELIRIIRGLSVSLFDRNSGSREAFLAVNAAGYRGPSWRAVEDKQWNWRRRRALDLLKSAAPQRCARVVPNPHRYSYRPVNRSAQPVKETGGLAIAVDNAKVADIKQYQ